MVNYWTNTYKFKIDKINHSKSESRTMYEVSKNKPLLYLSIIVNFNLNRKGKIALQGTLVKIFQGTLYWPKCFVNTHVSSWQRRWIKVKYCKNWQYKPGLAGSLLEIPESVNSYAS